MAPFLSPPFEGLVENSAMEGPLSCNWIGVLLRRIRTVPVPSRYSKAAGEAAGECGVCTVRSVLCSLAGATRHQRSANSTTEPGPHQHPYPSLRCGRSGKHGSSLGGTIWHSVLGTDAEGPLRSHFSGCMFLHLCEAKYVLRTKKTHYDLSTLSSEGSGIMLTVPVDFRGDMKGGKRGTMAPWCSQGCWWPF